MEPAARARTLVSIDAWIASSQEESPTDGEKLWSGDLTRSLKFKALAQVLGPDFRGAIVSCGFIGAMEPTAVWETRFLDLPLAATIFNLGSE
jgi:hypothetical protein